MSDQGKAKIPPYVTHESFKNFSETSLSAVGENSALHSCHVCQIPLCVMCENFRSLPITSVTSALFQWASLIMSIFSIYTIPHFTIYVFRSYTTTRTMSPCKPYICHFKAFNLYIEQDIGVMLKACQRTFWSRLDGLECCGCPEEPQEDNYITMSAISLCY